MNINLTLNKIKSDLISEANLNVNLRRMVYDYFSADDKKRQSAKRRNLSKVEGFADAKKAFMKKPKKLKILLN